MKDYSILNMMNNKKVIIIKNYELSIKDFINIVNVENVNEVIFVIDYLPQNNKFRSMSFVVTNKKIDMNKFTYLTNEQISIYMDYANNLKLKDFDCSRQ